MARHRQMVKFWLDMKHADQQWIAEVVENLRKHRQLARTIREGIALVVTLRQGDFSVLDELFPGVRQAPSSVPSQEFHELLRAVHELKAQQGRGVPENATPRLPAASRVEIASATSKANATTVAQNFANSMKSFASGFFD